MLSDISVSFPSKSLERREKSFNPFMHNVEKSLNILSKSCGAHTARFQSIFGHFSRLCMKRLTAFIVKLYPVGIYLLKVSNRNTRTRSKLCSKLIIKTAERRHWRRFGVFMVNFEQISHLVLLFLLLTLSM